MSGRQDNNAFDAGDGGGDAASPTEKMRADLAEAALPVRRYLFGMCGDWDTAEDLAQESLLKAWAKRESFNGRSSLRTWVFTIARNQWLDNLRRKTVAPREETMNENLTIAASDPSPEAAACRGELATAVRKAMDKLPGEQREVLALRESGGLTFDQIAQVLGIPSATAKSRARYALLKLAEELKGFQDGA